MHKKNEIFFKILKAYASQKKCVICKIEFANKANKQVSKTVNKDAITYCFIATDILIKTGCRACPYHFNEKTGLLSEDAFKMFRIYDHHHHTNIDGSEVELLLLALRERAIRNSIFDKFKSQFHPSDDLCLKTCGISKTHFIELYDLVSPHMNNSLSRSISQALAIYLFWLKTGYTQEFISAYFVNELTQSDFIAAKFVKHLLKISFDKNLVPTLKLWKNL